MRGCRASRGARDLWERILGSGSRTDEYRRSVTIVHSCVCAVRVGNLPRTGPEVVSLTMQARSLQKGVVHRGLAGVVAPAGYVTLWGMNATVTAEQQPPAPLPEVSGIRSMPGLGATLLRILGGAVATGLLTFVGWKLLHTTHLPAFGTSNVMRALVTAGVAVLILACVAVAMMDLRRWRWSTNTLVRWAMHAVAMLSPAGLVLVTMGIPLANTRMYLGGVSVDQEFRTQYLTRFADSWQLSDMNYADLPAYYPASWFWLGGRFASLGMPGWEAFQPWSIVSMAMAAAVLVPVWHRITGSLSVSLLVAMFTTGIVLTLSAEEPYAAIVAMGVPACAVLAGRAMRGGKASLVAVAVFLGVSATMYTLFTAVAALAVVLIAVEAAWANHSIRPLVRLAVAGGTSVAIALVFWGPYLLAVLRGRPRDPNAAAHYLPVEGTALSLPMFAASAIGVLSMLGVLFCIVRWRNLLARSLGLLVIATYSWEVASMVTPVIGFSLLGFRLDAVEVGGLVTAGLLAVVAIRTRGVVRLYPQGMSQPLQRAITTCVVVVMAAATLAYGQNVPARNAESIDLAYRTTDGYGERADQFPPSAAKYFPAIDAALGGQPPAEGGWAVDRANTVVLTDVQAFLAFYPYRGFQGFTAHYANPLGQFSERNELIEQWASQSWQESSDPQAFAREVEAAPWRSVDAWVFKVGGDQPRKAGTGGVSSKEQQAQDGSSSSESQSGGWTFALAEDIYPNDPNVRFRTVSFNPKVFTGPGSPWKVSEVGPFRVVTRAS